MNKSVPTNIAVALLLLGSVAVPAAPGAPAGPAQPSVWQHRQTTFNYSAFTTAYTCDGLESKVASILRYLGARDPKVQASGCPRGPQSLSHMIWVRVEFDTLGTAAADAPAGDIVQASWTAVQLDARRPSFMDGGDCELVQDIKPVLTQAFSFQDLSYESTCTPHQVGLQDFRVAGRVLKAAPEHAG